MDRLQVSFDARLQFVALAQRSLRRAIAFHMIPHQLSGIELKSNGTQPRIGGKKAQQVTKWLRCNCSLNQGAAPREFSQAIIKNALFGNGRLPL